MATDLNDYQMPEDSGTTIGKCLTFAEIEGLLAAERERCAAGEVYFGRGGLAGIRGSRADIDLVQHWQNEAHRAEYLAERLKLYLTEAQRLALLVRSLGGDPEPPSAPIRNLPPQTEGGKS